MNEVTHTRMICTMQDRGHTSPHKHTTKLWCHCSRKHTSLGTRRYTINCLSCSARWGTTARDVRGEVTRTTKSKVGCGDEHHTAYKLLRNSAHGGSQHAYTARGFARQDQIPLASHVRLTKREFRYYLHWIHIVRSKPFPYHSCGHVDHTTL